MVDMLDVVGNIRVQRNIGLLRTMRRVRHVTATAVLDR